MSIFTEIFLSLVVAELHHDLNIQATPFMDIWTGWHDLINKDGYLLYFYTWTVFGTFCMSFIQSVAWFNVLVPRFVFTNGNLMNHYVIKNSVCIVICYQSTLLNTF